jgi:hypothetical protein
MPIGLVANVQSTVMSSRPVVLAENGTRPRVRAATGPSARTSTVWVQGVGVGAGVAGAVGVELPPHAGSKRAPISPAVQRRFRICRVRRSSD